MRALGKLWASLLSAFDLVATQISSSYFPEMLVRGLTQGLHQVLDFGVIAKDGGLGVIFSNKLANLLGIKLSEW